MPRARYPSDLTDAEWRRLEPLVPAPLPGGRPPLHPRREIVNAILYVLRTGCQWRAVPHDLPPWGTVWWYFRLPDVRRGVGELTGGPDVIGVVMAVDHELDRFVGHVGDRLRQIGTE